MEDELIKRVKDHEEESVKELLIEYRPLIGKIVSSFLGNNGDYRLDRDDLMQEGGIALYRAALEFDENRNVRFSTYAYTVVRRAVLRTVRHYNRIYAMENKSLDREDFNLSWIGFKSEKYYDDPRQSLAFKESIRKAQQFLSTLSPEEQAILNLRQNNISYAEIGKKLAINEKRVDYLIQKMRKRSHESIMAE